MHKRNSIKICITLGGILESIGKGNRKEYFNSLSQIGGSLSQTTLLSEMMHAIEVLPISRYLEGKKNECYFPCSCSFSNCYLQEIAILEKSGQFPFVMVLSLSQIVYLYLDLKFLFMASKLNGPSPFYYIKLHFCLNLKC